MHRQRIVCYIAPTKYFQSPFFREVRSHSAERPTRSNENWGSWTTVTPVPSNLQGGIYFTLRRPTTNYSAYCCYAAIYRVLCCQGVLVGRLGWRRILVVSLSFTIAATVAVTGRAIPLRAAPGSNLFAIGSLYRLRSRLALDDLNCYRPLYQRSVPRIDVSCGMII